MTQENRHVRNGFGAIAAILCAALVTLTAAPDPGAAAEPIKIGIDLGMTGANGPTSGQILLSLQIWRDDVNAKGGLSGPARGDRLITTTRPIPPMCQATSLSSSTSTRSS